MSTKNLKEQFDELVSVGLCQVRIHENGKWFLYKYKNKVFYDDLWEESPLLVHARGIVLDSNGEIIHNPFVKIFNPHEKLCPKFEDDEICHWAEKVNGFLAVASYHDDELTVTTTGTFDSDYAALARKWVETLNVEALQASPFRSTFLFEVCDENDPHIVPEDIGIYLIGQRYNASLTEPLASEGLLDCYASHLGAKRRKHYEGTYADFQAMVKRDHMRAMEGYVIYSDDKSRASKVKLPYYLTTKFLGRGKKNQCIWTNPKLARKIIDEEYYGLIDWLKDFTTLEHWASMDTQTRIQMVEFYFANPTHVLYGP